MVSSGALLVLGFWVTLSPMLGIPWLVVLSPLPWRPLLVLGLRDHSLFRAALTCGWQPTTTKISTPWAAFRRSVTNHRESGPPTSHEITSKIQGTPITTTSFRHTLPSAALQQKVKYALLILQVMGREWV
ncbi:hypothetical protein QAD02_017149 [Eretmocerus hayati]|uniref:Uncharacterized protein n=1 Tax=Eretmocerus hayati TaxID=131215 RepID=A0ACC2PD35_9HYME|nr:hypothetical protein QAD02_017149 [Eretmocerus hayati]